MRLETETHHRPDGRAAPPPQRDSIAVLLKDLTYQSSKLVRQEVELAKAEMNEKAQRAARNGASIAIGGAVAYAGVLVLLAAASIGLAVLLAAAGLDLVLWASWLAPLIVGAIVAVIGYAMVQKGISTLKRESLVPTQTMDSLRETRQWAQHKAQTTTQEASA